MEKLLRYREESEGMIKRLQLEYQNILFSFLSEFYV